MCKCIENLESETPEIELRQTYHVTGNVLVGVAKWVKHPRADFHIWGRRKYHNIPWKFCPLCGKPWQSSNNHGNPGLKL